MTVAARQLPGGQRARARPPRAKPRGPAPPFPPRPARRRLVGGDRPSRAVVARERDPGDIGAEAHTQQVVVAAGGGAEEEVLLAVGAAGDGARLVERGHRGPPEEFHLLSGRAAAPAV